MNIYGKRGFLIRVVYLMGAIFWYVVTLGGRLCCDNTVVLCYHGICSDHRECFQRQMSRISDRAVGVKDISLGKPSSKSSCLCILITFDDAFTNLLDNALPILERYHIPTVIFAVSGNFGQTPKWYMPQGHPETEETVMTAGQLQSISSENVIIGSHTQNHPNLAGLLPDQIRKELSESKSTLEQLLQKPVEDLALPHGSFNSDVLEIAGQVGYKRIYSLDPILLGGQKKEGLIGRFSMSPDVWPIEFSLTCAGSYFWLLYWRQFLRYLKMIVRSEK